MAQVGGTIYSVNDGRVKSTLRRMAHKKKKRKKKKHWVYDGIGLLSSTTLLESLSWECFLSFSTSCIWKLSSASISLAKKDLEFRHVNKFVHYLTVAGIGKWTSYKER